ncbi:MAG: hypothetical protein JXQ73_19455 [Phycisphaerae bacterium]|nr:hypothetical protein [Phycisphaerae bacterium]
MRCRRGLCEPLVVLGPYAQGRLIRTDTTMFPSFMAFLFLVLLSAGLPATAWMLLARSLRRAVPDPARRGRAWQRKLKVQRGAGPWDRLCFAAVVLLASVILLRLLLDARFPLRIPFWSTTALIFAMIALVYAYLYAGHRREKRFFATLQQSHHLICPDCHYSLAGHTHGGTCPECGYTFTPDSLIEDWLDTMKMARIRRSSP